KPDINHLCVFGCDAYVHIHDRKKMDPKSVPGIFIGYDLIKENGYRVYDVENNKIIVSRDVSFNESSFTIGRNLQNTTTITTYNEIIFDDNDNNIPTSILQPIPDESHIDLTQDNKH